jgi:hypothetical protein
MPATPQAPLNSESEMIADDARHGNKLNLSLGQAGFAI